MRINKLIARILIAIVASMLLNGLVIGAFAHVASTHGATVASDART